MKRERWKQTWGHLRIFLSFGRNPGSQCLTQSQRRHRGVIWVRWGGKEESEIQNSSSVFSGSMGSFPLPELARLFFLCPHSNYLACLIFYRPWTKMCFSFKTQCKSYLLQRSFSDCLPSCNKIDVISSFLGLYLALWITVAEYSSYSCFCVGTCFHTYTTIRQTSYSPKRLSPHGSNYSPLVSKPRHPFVYPATHP